MLMNAAGIISEPLVINNARRGETFWTTMTFMNPENNPIDFDLSANGDIAKWVTYYNNNDSKTSIVKISVPAQNNINAKVKIEIPDGIPNGKYKGKLIGTTILSPAPVSGKNTVQIKQLLDRDVTIIVTDTQDLQFTTQFIPIKYTLSKDEPFAVKVIHTNTGNVDISPNIELQVSKDGQVVFKALFPYPDNTEPLQPNNRKEIDDQVIWRTKGYDPGIYDINLAAYVDNHVYQKSEFPITIGNGNTSDFLTATLSKFGFTKGVNLWLFAVAVIILGILLVAIKLRTKSANNTKPYSNDQ